MQVITTTSMSPDKLWLAESLVASPRTGAGDYYTRLVLRRVDDTIVWTVVDLWSPWGMGYTTPQPFLWTRDGRSFYFTNKAHPDGCVTAVNASDLYRVDVSSGTVTQIAPPVGLWLALSPDERSLAYISFRQTELVMRDLVSGRERSVDLEQKQSDTHFVSNQAGHIQWSPDGSMLVYTLAIRPCSGGPPQSASVWAESTTIMRVDAAAARQTPLLREDQRLLVTTAWPAADRVLLKDRDGQLWTMNPMTGEVSR